jgi:hypothetical protein
MEDGNPFEDPLASQELSTYLALVQNFVNDPANNIPASEAQAVKQIVNQFVEAISSLPPSNFQSVIDSTKSLLVTLCGQGGGCPYPVPYTPSSNEVTFSLSLNAEWMLAYAMGTNTLSANSADILAICGELAQSYPSTPGNYPSFAQFQQDLANFQSNPAAGASQLQTDLQQIFLAFQNS